MCAEAADKPRPIVILGPTAGGKSELAVELAEQLDGQVIGADSMQVYRHMDAGTAKPEPELQARAKHHMIDIVEPTERFTVADWLEQTERLIADLQAAGKRPIVVGGTNLYIKALLEGMFEGPAIDQAFRAELADIDSAELHRQLKAKDPEAAERIHPNDRKRLTRALEVLHLTGQPISAQQQQWDQFGQSRDSDADRPAAPSYRHDPILIGLRWAPEAINPRINLRVKAMFHPDKAREQDGLEWPWRESLPDETRRLEDAGLLGPQAREALGYKQVLQAMIGRMSLDDAMEKTKIETRRFGKQQRTWLKRFRGVHWIEADQIEGPERTARALAIVRVS